MQNRDVTPQAPTLVVNRNRSKWQRTRKIPAHARTDQQRESSSRGFWSKTFDLIVLWTPDINKSGFRGGLNAALGLALILLRQVFLPFLIFAPAVLISLPFGRAIDPNSLVVSLCVIFVLALVEEASRYSFARNANRPGQAIIIFTIGIIILETCLYWAQSRAPILTELLLRLPSWLIHIGAGIALFWALQDRKIRFTPTFAITVIVHTGINFATTLVLNDNTRKLLHSLGFTL